MQSIWNQYGGLSENWESIYSQDPALSLLGTYLMYSQSHHKDTCSTMFIAALFLISKSLDDLNASHQSWVDTESTTGMSLSSGTPQALTLPMWLGFNGQMFLPNNSILHSSLSINAWLSKPYSDFFLSTRIFWKSVHHLMSPPFKSPNWKFYSHQGSRLWSHSEKSFFMLQFPVYPYRRHKLQQSYT